MDKGYCKSVLNQLVDMGEAMLTAGASVNRVEKTLMKMGTAYGAVQMDVFVITSCVIVSVDFGKGIELTRTRRILGSGGSNFSKVEAFSELSESCCRQVMPVQELASSIAEIKQSYYPVHLVYLGSALAAGGFAVFFGGNLIDGLLAAIVGLLICYCQKRIGRIAPNQVVFLILCAFCAGMVITVMGNAIPDIHPDKIMIGDIMLLIPGIAMTNSVRDILVGDTISGLMRLIETIVWAGGLAVGFMIPMWII